MSILRFKDKNNVWHDVYALKGEKGDPGESPSEEDLDAIIAIQEELIARGGIIVDGMPAVGNEGDVLTVVDEKWQAAKPASGGQDYFAAVEDVDAGKKLTVDGTLVVSADNTVINGVSHLPLEKDGMSYGMIGGIEVPDDDYPYCAVNKRYVDEAVANAGGGAAVVNADWNASEGEAGYIKNRTHYKTETWTAWIENLSLTTELEDSGYSFAQYSFVANDGGVPDESHPIFVLGNKYKVVFDGQEYVCTAFNPVANGNEYPAYIGNAALKSEEGWTGGDSALPFFFGFSKGTGRNCLLYTETAGDHTISVERSITTYNTIDPAYLPDSVRADKYVEEHLTANFSSNDASNPNFVGRKWSNGLLEVEGSFSYAPSSCLLIETVYDCGNLFLELTGTDNLKFVGAPSFASCSVDGAGVWTNCVPVAGDACASLSYFSAIPENTTAFHTYVYIRGRWK